MCNIFINTTTDAKTYPASQTRYHHTNHTKPHKNTAQICHHTFCSHVWARAAFDIRSPRFRHRPNAAREPSHVDTYYISHTGIRRIMPSPHLVAFGACVRTHTHTAQDVLTIYEYTKQMCTTNCSEHTTHNEHTTHLSLWVRRFVFRMRVLVLWFVYADTVFFPPSVVILSPTPRTTAELCVRHLYAYEYIECTWLHSRNRYAEPWNADRQFFVR